MRTKNLYPVRVILWLVFRIKRKTTVFNRQNLNLSKLAEKPPPLFCLLVRYPAHIAWCDVTLPNCISHIIEHRIDDLAEKPPPEAAKQGNFFRLDLSISCNFQQLWVQLAESPPLPLSQPNREIFLDWIYSFHAISSNFGFSWQKPPLPMGRDPVRHPAHITHGEYPWSPYYKSTLRFLLSEYLL